MRLWIERFSSPFIFFSLTSSLNFCYISFCLSPLSICLVLNFSFFFRFKVTSSLFCLSLSMYLLFLLFYFFSLFFFRTSIVSSYSNKDGPSLAEINKYAFENNCFVRFLSVLVCPYMFFSPCHYVSGEHRE